MKENIKEKVLKQLYKEINECYYDFTKHRVRQFVKNAVEETSKQYENKIKELENEIEKEKLVSSHWIGLHKWRKEQVDKKNKQINQLKKQLKDQRKKIFIEGKKT